MKLFHFCREFAAGESGREWEREQDRKTFYFQKARFLQNRKKKNLEDSKRNKETFLYATVYSFIQWMQMLRHQRIILRYGDGDLCEVCKKWRFLAKKPVAFHFSCVMSLFQRRYCQESLCLKTTILKTTLIATVSGWKLYSLRVNCDLIYFIIIYD